MKMPQEDSNPLGDANSRDRGDDVQRRFRYQHTYTVIKSLILLDEENDFSELYCEKLEDILMRRKDGKFIGIQVKTRDNGMVPFKTTDEEIIDTIKRFIYYENNYSSKFYQYVIASSIGFWHETDNSSNLIFLLSKLGDESAILDSDHDFSRLLRKIKEGCTIDNTTIFKTLKKIQLDNSSGLSNINDHLVSCLSNYIELKEKSYEEIKKISLRLIQKIYEASSLNYQSPTHDYFILSDNPQDSINQEILDGKKITKEIITATIKQELRPQNLIQTNRDIDISILPPGTRKLKLKMIKGDISLSSVQLFEDYKHVAENYFQKVLYKKDPGQANALFDSLSLIVKTECIETYDSLFSSEHSFGKEMLQQVRRKLRDRYTEDCKWMFSGSYEHLLGIAGIITEECGIWWSAEFEIKDDST